MASNIKTYYFWQFTVLFSFLLTLVVNFMAAVVGINGQLTAAVSDKYPTLFTPAGYVFSIWSLIYLLLIGFIIFQFIVVDQSRSIHKIRMLFILSNLLNSGWMLSWHYDLLLLSVALMISLLVCLISIYLTIYSLKPTQVTAKLFLQSTFQIYLGWICVATIANIAVYLYSVNWTGWGISPIIWTIIMMSISATLAIIHLVKYRDYLFNSVIIWALIGIAAKQHSYQITNAVLTLVGVIVLFGIVQLMSQSLNKSS